MLCLSPVQVAVVVLVSLCETAWQMGTSKTNMTLSKACLACNGTVLEGAIMAILDSVIFALPCPALPCPAPPCPANLLLHVTYKLMSFEWVSSRFKPYSPLDLLSPHLPLALPALSVT